MSIIVQKFGGTSVGSSFAIRKVFEIVSSTPGKRIVVLSASAGITDKLVRISETCLSKETNGYKELFEEIEKHHLKLIIELFENSDESASCIREVNFILQSLLRLIHGVRILDELTDKVKAEILSYGEILSSSIFHHFSLFRGLNTFLLDARQIIETDNYHLEAKPNLNKIEQNGAKIRKIFENYDVIVTQGFIGNWQKETTVLGRGGSDFSASLFGFSVDADEIQIWTDVDGIMTTDPKVVPNAKVIETISFEEVTELSFFGAKVLHPETIKPAMIKRIPVKVLNTFFPEGKGTTILPEIVNNNHHSRIRSLHLIEDCFLLRRKLDLNSKDIGYYLEFVQDNFGKLFNFSHNRNNFTSIVKGGKCSNISSLLSDEAIEFDKFDLIAFFGPNLSNLDSFSLQKLFEILFSFNDILGNSFLQFVSIHSAILLVKEGKGKEVVGKIHSMLFD